MVLHKADCNASYSHRRQYIDPINRAYNERFENLDQYKHENNFKRLLGAISLYEVKATAQRAKYSLNSRLC